MAINAGLPKYAPSKSPEPVAEGIISLPEFEVRDSKLVTPTDAEVLTKTGRTELLRKRYPGVSLKGQDPDNRQGTPNYAALMHQEEVRKARKQELTNFAETLRAVGDDSTSKALRKEIDRTFERRPSWREEGMDKAYNNGRR